MNPFIAIIDGLDLPGAACHVKISALDAVEIRCDWPDDDTTVTYRYKLAQQELDIINGTDQQAIDQLVGEILMKIENDVSFFATQQVAVYRTKA